MEYAEWIEVTQNEDDHRKKCSDCNFIVNSWLTHVYNYCPNCGAKMNKAPIYVKVIEKVQNFIIKMITESRKEQQVDAWVRKKGKNVLVVEMKTCVTFIQKREEK